MRLLPLFIFFVVLAAHAERMTTRIHSIDTSPDLKGPHLVLFENGRVSFVDPAEKSVLNTLLLSKNEWLDVELDSEGNFLGAGVVPEPKGLAKEEHYGEEKGISYEPSNLSSLNEARNIFKRMRRNYQWVSQCYNRAHVWTYEEFKRSGLRSMKLFMFFTRSYIRRYRYQWWFHVTPMTYVNSVPTVLDRGFMGGPVSIKTWTDKFIYSKRNCPIIYKYSDYRNHQDGQHCYLHPASMYFWQPRDLDNFERTGYEKTQYVRSDINWAYYEAF